jgi:hypothetical protein
MLMYALISSLSWKIPGPQLTRLPLVLIVLLWIPLAVAQNTLGELLDAGAAKISAEDFKREVVQHAIVGPTPQGGQLEVIYASNGQIQGLGKGRFTMRDVQLSGEWKIDGGGAICTSMRSGEVALPYRCQAWFKLAQDYFISDSDSDRYARVLRRTVKR